MSSTPTPGRFLPGGIFQSLTQQPASHFSVGDVPAPTALYIGADSFLRVNVLSIAFGVKLTCHTRVLRSEDGIITTSEDPVVPAVALAPNLFIIPLTEGFLLSAIITAESTNLFRGQTFVSLELCHGAANNVHRDALLIQDYVATNYAASWPGGTVKLATEGPGVISQLQAGNPPAGNEASVGFGAGIRSRLMTAVLTLTTSAAAANRQPVIKFSVTGVEFYRVTTAAPIPASTVATLVLGADVGAPSVNSNVHLLPIPQNMLMAGNSQVTTATTGIQAADQYSNITLLSEQWFDS